MRDAQSAFDQVISFAGSEIEKEDVELALGVAGADILTRIANGIAENNIAEAMAVIDEVVMRGHDLRNFCRDLLAHLRDLLVTKVSGSPELLESAVCDVAELQRQAALFSESDLVRFFHSLADTETKLSKAAQPRYQLEIGLVKLMEMRRLQPMSELLERLSALEQAIRGEAGPVQPRASSPTGGSPPAAPVKRTPTETSRGSKAAGGSFAAATAVKPALEPAESQLKANVETIVPVESGISEVAGVASEVERIKSLLETKRKMFLVTVLEAASSITLFEKELCIEFSPEARHFRDTLTKSDNVKALRDVCQEITGGEIGVRITIQDHESLGAPASKEEEERCEKQQLRETAEKNALVQKMLRTFRGEIVDVRRVDAE
jgi:DNA polymerase-3 subunit gamma/tau